MEKITIIIPVYNEALTIKYDAEAILKTMDAAFLNCELLLVDDGSRDSTWLEIQALSERRKEVYGIRLSRSFGKDSAIFAGLDNVKTALCVVSDTSHRPTLIKEMHNVMLDMGADAVEAAFPEMPPGIFRRFKLWLYKALTGKEAETKPGFVLFNRKVMNALGKFENLSFASCFEYAGFKTERVPALPEEAPLPGGEEKIFANFLSDMPKALLLPFFFSALSFLGMIACGIYNLVIFAGWGEFPSADSFLILLLGTALFLTAGTLGIYMKELSAKITKSPRYVITDKSGGIFNKRRTRPVAPENNEET